MSNFNWNQVSSSYHQAKVGEFTAEVWELGNGKWRFRWAGTLDPQSYDTALIAKAACEIRGIAQIVNACTELGYVVRVPPIA